MLYKMTRMKGATSISLNKHNKIVRELPRHIESRMQNVIARNEILHATEAYNAKLEKDRVTAHLHRMAPGLQRLAAEHHVGKLQQRLHHLANKGI